MDEEPGYAEAGKRNSQAADRQGDGVSGAGSTALPQRRAKTGSACRRPPQPARTKVASRNRLFNPSWPKRPPPEAATQVAAEVRCRARVDVPRMRPPPKSPAGAGQAKGRCCATNSGQASATRVPYRPGEVKTGFPGISG